MGIDDLTIYRQPVFNFARTSMELFKIVVMCSYISKHGVASYISDLMGHRDALQKSSASVGGHLGTLEAFHHPSSTQCLMSRCTNKSSLINTIAVFIFYDPSILIQMKDLRIMFKGPIALLMALYTATLSLKLQHS